MSAGSAEQTQKLAAALRAGASQAAEEAGGGLALVFASNGGGSPLDVRLRAAAGFALAEDARDAARDLLVSVREALEAKAPTAYAAMPSLGDRAEGGLLIHPLALGAFVHGALVVGSPSALEAPQREVVAEIAERLSLQLDHARLQAECESLRERASRVAESGGGEQSDEVLRLSEALFAQDIELLRSNEKLGKIERLKNDFIEKMSRELRTPLNSIIEAIISVMTGEDEALSEGAKSAMRSALDEGSAFLRTLQNILDLWKIKQGELEVEVQDVNFRELLDEAIFSIQESIGEKQLAVERSLAEGFPRIRTDLAKLNQILFLLLDNAAKFTPAGEIEVSARVEGGRLYCAVRDTGIGIAPDDQQLVFDEFFQVDDPASHKYRGAGLGLSLVRDLVVLLDGEVSVASEIGRGTTVNVQIPLHG